MRAVCVFYVWLSAARGFVLSFSPFYFLNLLKLLKLLPLYCFFSSFICKILFALAVLLSLIHYSMYAL